MPILNLIPFLFLGPPVLNFGDICVNSINTYRLNVVNMLPKYVLIHLDANLKELQKTKQLSYVIPPSASTHISVIFQTPTTGKFWRYDLFSNFYFLESKCPIIGYVFTCPIDNICYIWSQNIKTIYVSIRRFIDSYFSCSLLSWLVWCFKNWGC